MTAAILGAVEDRQAGIASAVNNAISRISGLLAIAALGFVIGPSLTLAGFHRSIEAMSAVLILGGLISAFGIRNSASQLAALKR